MCQLNADITHTKEISVLWQIILFSYKGTAAGLAQGGWAGSHPKLAPYYRRTGQLVRFGTLEISITFTPFFQPNQGHTTIHNMPPRDFMGSHTSLNPYSKKVDSLFWLKKQTKKLLLPSFVVGHLIYHRNTYFKNLLHKNT